MYLRWLRVTTTIHRFFHHKSLGGTCKIFSRLHCSSVKVNSESNCCCCWASPPTALPTLVAFHLIWCGTSKSIFANCLSTGMLPPLMPTSSSNSLARHVLLHNELTQRSLLNNWQLIFYDKWFPPLIMIGSSFSPSVIIVGVSSRKNEAITLYDRASQVSPPTKNIHEISLSLARI